MPVNYESVVRPAWSLSVDRIDDLYLGAKQKLEEYADNVLGAGVEYHVRAVVPSDLGETNDIWAETVTATGSAYQDSQIASQQISDDVGVCFLGLVDTSDPQVVTAVRIQAGNSVRAQWDLFPILGSDPQNLPHRTVYAMNPVILTRRMVLTVRYYVRAFSPQVVSGVELALLGLIVEKAGTVIEA